jgi:hypothetical protein
MWAARFDTADISAALRLPEATIAQWVANFREAVRTCGRSPARGPGADVI